MDSNDKSIEQQLADAGVSFSTVEISTDGEIREVPMGGMFAGLTEIGAPMHEENSSPYGELFDGALAVPAPLYVTSETITTDSVTVAVNDELTANDAMRMFMDVTGVAAQHLIAGHDTPEPVVFVKDGRIAMRFRTVCTHNA